MLEPTIRSSVTPCKLDTYHKDGGGGTQIPCCSIGREHVKVPLYGDDCEAH